MFRMAFYTNRNNVKPMFTFIALVMVIFFGRFGAIMALQRIWTRQFADFYSIINSISSIEFLSYCRLVLL